MSVSGSAARAGKGVPKYPGRDVLEAALGPLLGPAAHSLAGSHIQRLLGYWVMTRVFGGRDALIEQGIVSRAGAYKSEREFREAFGFPPEELSIARVFGLEQEDTP